MKVLIWDLGVLERKGESPDQTPTSIGVSTGSGRRVGRRVRDTVTPSRRRRPATTSFDLHPPVHPTNPRSRTRRLQVPRLDFVGPYPLSSTLFGPSGPFLHLE